MYWEFCGKSFFTGVAEENDGTETVDHISMHLWQFAQCIEFMHEGYKSDPIVEYMLNHT